jgi:hypothetical protein
MGCWSFVVDLVFDDTLYKKINPFVSGHEQYVRCFEFHQLPYHQHYLICQNPAIHYRIGLVRLHFHDHLHFHVHPHFHLNNLL